MSKYVIKNCPNITFIDFWRLDKSKSSYCKLKNCGCENYTDCLIKQVIEKCKSVDCDCIVDKKNCGQMDNMPMCCDLWKSKDILRLFEIEECE